MAKQVLVIGGSYFAGRVFAILCSRGEDFELHVVNRGKYKLNKDHVTEYVCDRHDFDKLAQVVPNIKFDAVVDFCAYNKGEIAPIVDRLHDRISQYIFISTSSVYVNDDNSVKKEGDPILYESTDDMVAQYICGKSQLEKELIETTEKYSIPYTILRPAFIYGPFNYAPRQSWYIEKIVRHKPVPKLVDSTAHFSFVYVSDVARALQAMIGNEKAYNEIFNVSAPEVLTNEAFLDELVAQNGAPFETQDVTVEEVLKNNIAIPFPLTDDEVYDGTKLANTFGFEYTDFHEGMRKAFNAFKRVYE